MTDEAPEAGLGSRWIRGVIQLRWAVIALFGLLAVAALPGLARIDVDNRAKVFFPGDSHALERYGHFNRLFGGDRAVRLVASVEGEWSTERLAWWADFEDRAAKLPGVVTTIGLASLHRWHLNEWPPSDEFVHTIARDPFHRSASLLSHDGEQLSLIVGLMPLVPEGTRLALQRLEALAESVPPGVGVRVVGIPTVSRALDEGVFDIMTNLFPIMTFAVALLVLLIVRSPVDSALPLLFVGVCVGMLFGCMGWLGITLNIAVSVVAPLLFVIGLASAVHVLLGFRAWQHSGADAFEAVERVYAEKGWAVFWTCATTGIAFGSLLAARVPPVRSMGLWCTTGMAVVLVASFTLYPALLACLASRPRPEGAFERVCSAWGPRLAEAAMRWRRSILMGTALLAMLALAGVSRLDFDSSVLRYFDRDHAVRSGVESLEAAGLPVATAEIVIHDRRQPPRLRDGAELERLNGLARALEAEPEVFGAVSAGGLAAGVTRWVPETGDLAAARDRIESHPTARLLLGALVTEDGSAARVIAAIPMRGYQELDPILARVIEHTREWFPDSEVELTGQYPLVLSAQRGMFRTLALSLSATCVGVIVVLLLLVRDVRITLRALLPNLLPVVVLLGAIGALGFPLNSGTMTVPAVALGLAVDDTLHTLAHFRRLLPRLGAREAIVQTLRLTTGAHVLTALLLATGFLCVATAELRPISEFGMLLAAGVALALIGDLLLIPALLAGGEAHENRHGRQDGEPL